MKVRAIQRVGDRDDWYWSIKDIAFTLTANAQSKVQLLVLSYEEDDSTRWRSGQSAMEHKGLCVHNPGQPNERQDTNGIGNP